MKARYLLILCLVSAIDANAQSAIFEWAKSMTGTATCEGKSITLDAAGNVLTTGVLRGTADFDPGPGIYNLTSAGDADIFISKLDASGNFLWAKQVGGPSVEMSESVATDPAGNVYVTGYFLWQAGVDFDPGPGVFILSSVAREAFVLKLDADGNFVWAKSIEGDNSEGGTSLAIDAAGNLLITGYFSATVDFDGGPGNVSLTSQGAADIFLTKWDGNGNFIWVKQMGGTGSDYVYKLALDATGNILLTGYFYETADFDPGAGNYNLTSAGNADIYICKLDNNGNFIWAKSIGGPVIESCYGITSDLSGNIFIATPIASIFDVDPGPGVTNVSTVGGFDALICKYSPAGDFLWARKWGANGNDNIFDIKTDAAGNVYTGGEFSGTIDFDPGPAEVFKTATGGNDLFYIKWDANGNFVWVAQLPGIGGTIYSLYVNAANEIFSTGLFSGTVDFDPGTGTYNLTSTSSDVFVNKLSQGLVGGPLPLTLLSFTGEATPMGNVLKWQTVQEVNTKHFEIEWSDDGQRFQQVGVQAAAGNSFITLQYSHLHNNTVEGNNYYRLKMMDIDGQFTYSPVVQTKVNTSSTAITVFPNPVADFLQMKIKAVKNETIALELHNTDGKRVASKVVSLIKGSNLLNWKLPPLSSGNYFIICGNKNFKTIQISKK